MIYAVDFDGTLCVEKYPGIGEARQNVIDFCKQKKAEGHKLILWTCRCGEYLEQAIKWCEEQELIFDAVNENLPERIAEYGGDCRKISADYYIDDKNICVVSI